MKALSRLLMAAAVVLAGVSGTVQGQQNTLIEPNAMATLTRMGGYLRSLKSFQVDAVTSTEQVLEDGQKVQFAGVTNILARMPDRLRISVHTLPPACSAVIVNGFMYQQCGTVWYQPQIAGGSTTYAVINAPR